MLQPLNQHELFVERFLHLFRTEATIRS